MEPISANIITNIISSILYEAAKGIYPIINGRYYKDFQNARQVALDKTDKEFMGKIQETFVNDMFLKRLLSFEKKDRENLLSLYIEGKLPQNEGQYLDRFVNQAEEYCREFRRECQPEDAKEIIAYFFTELYNALQSNHELFSYINAREQTTRQQILETKVDLIINHFGILTPGISSNGVEFPSEISIPEKYKKWVDDRCKKLEIGALLEEQEVIVITLPEIFIPLYTNDLLRERKHKKPGQQEPVDIEQLIENQGFLLIRGQAGSGKTTLMKHLAYTIIKENNKFGFSGYLPVLLVLKDLQDVVNKQGYQGSGTATAIDFLTAYLSHNGLDFPILKWFSQKNRLIFLVDGLDEIDMALRDLIVDSLADFRLQYPCKMLFSGRPHGLKGSVINRFGDKILNINTLNQEQIALFINRWFQYLYSGGSDIGGQVAQGMINDLSSHPNVSQLLDTPLMLTAVCIVYHNKGRLPEQRAELYKKFIDHLIYKKFKENSRDVYCFLATLANKVHETRNRGFGKDLAYQVMGQVFPKKDLETPEQYNLWRKKRFDDIEQNCGLLKLEDGIYDFWHLSFQAFLTAYYMFEYNGELPVSYWDEDWFKETVELYIGYATIAEVKRAIMKQLQKNDQSPFRYWLLASRSLLDVHPSRRRSASEVVEQSKERLKYIIELDEEAPLIKADAGEILGWLGDPRDLKEFISIKGGEYELEGLGKKEIAPFWIAKYPVTNQWYKEFIEAEGYEKPEYWSLNGQKWLAQQKEKIPLYWHERKWNCPNAPVVGVCWYEAVAFCRWLSAEDKHFKYWLPTEQEWQAAAAGKKGRKYPWGDDFDENKCNVVETNIGRTSAVGIFISGNTPEEVADLSGNVWEWTRTKYDTKEARPDFTLDEKWGKWPVLRGGSWFYNLGNARCAYRNSSDPNSRYSDIGFLVARTKKA
jgi:formylglycine-generating enzyme required for sulfatase activity/energy-coupling factor transporter ATP-binding protein EcfA2